MKNTTKYFVIYVSYNRCIIECVQYTDLNNAICDALYWKNHPETKGRIWQIEIAKTWRINTISVLN